jgi:hypothetical protein
MKDFNGTPLSPFLPSRNIHRMLVVAGNQSGMAEVIQRSESRSNGAKRFLRPVAFAIVQVDNVTYTRQSAVSQSPRLSYAFNC